MAKRHHENRFILNYEIGNVRKLWEQKALHYPASRDEGPDAGALGDCIQHPSGFREQVAAEALSLLLVPLGSRSKLRVRPLVDDDIHPRFAWRRAAIRARTASHGSNFAVPRSTS
jgi:hypothetical protein